MKLITDKMEKLINLLNEYAEKKINTPNRCIGYSCCYFGFDGGTDVIEDTIISKRYGLIKRLVENDKIDLDKVKDNSELYLTIKSNDDEKLLYTKVIIMLLSISDTPIEDLVSLLK